MKADRALILTLITILLVLSFVLVRPYLQFLLAALVLAFVLRPLQARLVGRIGRTPAAVSLLLLSVFALVVPFFVVVAFVAGDIMRIIGAVEDGTLEFATIEEPIEEALGIDLDLASAITSALEGVGTADGVMAAFGTLTHLLIGIGLLLFLLFFFVRDSDRLVAWIRDISPMPEPVTDDLLERLSAITKAVLAGHVLVAIIQGSIAGVGLLVTGVPNAVFWTFVMILLALIPLIGSFAVWAPASVYLYWTGEPIAAVALFVYGAVVVGVSDEFLRPIIVDRYASVSPSVIIVGVIGGISVFGFMGLFVGPIVVAALKETIEVYDDHYGRQTQHSA